MCCFYEWLPSLFCQRCDCHKLTDGILPPLLVLSFKCLSVCLRCFCISVFYAASLSELIQRWRLASFSSSTFLFCCCASCLWFPSSSCCESSCMLYCLILTLGNISHSVCCIFIKSLSSFYRSVLCLFLFLFVSHSVFSLCYVWNKGSSELGVKLCRPPLSWSWKQHIILLLQLLHPYLARKWVGSPNRQLDILYAQNFTRAAIVGLKRLNPFMIVAKNAFQRRLMQDLFFLNGRLHYEPKHTMMHESWTYENQQQSQIYK